VVEKTFCLCDAIKIFESKGFSHSESIVLATKYHYANGSFSNDECVSRKIKIFHDEHPDWSNDKCVAAAIGYCREHIE
jgi:hypothetical protein